jgi:hypothetical protein
VTLLEWAHKWRISPDALRDLCNTAIVAPTVQDLTKSEARVQSEVRLEAAQKGYYLFRNNVGALQDKTGRVVRYGLGNDSSAVNEHFKSADLIGLRRVLITEAMVGQHVGQFVSVECKGGNWKWAATPRECAQLAWANLINAQGGHAVIVNAAGTL